MPRRTLFIATVLLAATSSLYAQQSGPVQRWRNQTPPARGDAGRPAPSPRTAQPRQPSAPAAEAQSPSGNGVADQRRNPGQGDRGNGGGADRGNGRRPDGPRVAVPRTGPAPRPQPRGGYIAPRPPIRNYYYSRPAYPYGYGAFGLGYFYYDPYGWYPRGGGVRYFDGGYYGRGYGYDIGEVRLRVTPRNAQVMVDGYYAGVVDDYDGTFQSLRLESGPYHIEIVAPGYDTLAFDLRVTAGNKVTYRGDLRPRP